MCAADGLPTPQLHQGSCLVTAAASCRAHHNSRCHRPPCSVCCLTLLQDKRGASDGGDVSSSIPISLPIGCGFWSSPFFSHADQTRLGVGRVVSATLRWPGLCIIGEARDCELDHKTAPGHTAPRTLLRDHRATGSPCLSRKQETAAHAENATPSRTQPEGGLAN
jgi:hypothetical protein